MLTYVFTNPIAQSLARSLSRALTFTITRIDGLTHALPTDALTHSFTRILSHPRSYARIQFGYSRTYSLTYVRTLSFTCPRILLQARYVSYSLTHLHVYPRTHSITRLLAHSTIYLLAHLLSHLLAPSLADSLTYALSWLRNRSAAYALTNLPPCTFVYIRTHAAT